jgi:hypothetical protein
LSSRANLSWSSGGRPACQLGVFSIDAGSLSRPSRERSAQGRSSSGPNKERSSRGSPIAKSSTATCTTVRITQGPRLTQHSRFTLALADVGRQAYFGANGPAVPLVGLLPPGIIGAGAGAGARAGAPPCRRESSWATSGFRLQVWPNIAMMSCMDQNAPSGTRRVIDQGVRERIRPASTPCFLAASSCR